VPNYCPHEPSISLPVARSKVWTQPPKVVTAIVFPSVLNATCLTTPGTDKLRTSLPVSASHTRTTFSPVVTTKRPSGLNVDPRCDSCRVSCQIFRVGPVPAFSRRCSRGAATSGGKSAGIILPISYWPLCLPASFRRITCSYSSRALSCFRLPLSPYL